MRAVTVLHYYYGFPHVKVFSKEYNGLKKERMIGKVKHWAFLHYRKEYDSGVLRIIYYEDIADITTAEVIPL
jgi:hypothetical protein